MTDETKEDYICPNCNEEYKELGGWCVCEEDQPKLTLCCRAEYDEDIARCPDCKENV